MKKLDTPNILHITNWYPSDEKPFEAIWIKRHLVTLSKYCKNTVVHIQVKSQSSFGFKRGKYKDGALYYICQFPGNRTFAVELVTFILLLWVLIKYGRKSKTDIINFHIAYPLLRYWKIIKGFFCSNVLVNEHYSAYRYSFNIPGHPKLKHIQQIFDNKFTLLPVSASLRNEIEKFYGQKIVNAHILPNVIPSGMVYNPYIEKENIFFCLTNFNYPKRLAISIDAFLLFAQKNALFNLYIAGVDKEHPGFEAWKSNKLFHERVKIIGRIEEWQVVDYMQKSMGLLHCSDYETFSVVCLEALATGLPVIASNVGGIPEFVNHKNGILVKENTVSAWLEALEKFINEYGRFDAKLISEQINQGYSASVVGEKYYNIVKQILNDKG